MQAGSGGIRYNDTEKHIQLMDTDKNWINWRYYNPNYRFGRIVSSGTTNYSYNFQKDGLYILVSCAYSGRLNVTSTCSTVKSIYYNQELQTRYVTLMGFFANTEQNITITQPSNSYNNAIGLYYIGTGFSNLTLVQDIYVYDTNQTLAINNATNRVLIGAIESRTIRQVLVSSDSEYCDTDGQYSGCIFVPDFGSASISTRVDGSYATNFLADLQLS